MLLEIKLLGKKPFDSSLQRPEAHQNDIRKRETKRPFFTKIIWETTHVIQSLKRKPMALARLIYRNELFHREAYRHFFNQAMESVSERQACRLTVDFLALAHENRCEAEIADAIEASLRTCTFPDVESLINRFAIKEHSMPYQHVAVGNLGQHSSLLGNRLSP